MTDDQIKLAYKVARRLSWRFSAEGMDKEDWIQEGIIGLLKAEKNYREMEGIPWQHWAAATCRRIMLAKLRETRIGKRFSGRPTMQLRPDNEEDNGFIDRAPSAEELAIAAEELSIMEEALDKLSPTQQAIMDARLEGKSYQAISRETGVSATRIREREDMITAWLREYLTDRGIR